MAEKKDYTKPLDRDKALKEEKSFVGASEKEKYRIRIMTYNIHSCINIKSRVNPAAIRRVIKYLDPDVAALQEVDVNMARTGYENQARYLSESLGMSHFFCPTVRNGSEAYGIAMLSKHPITKIKEGLFPLSKRRRQEPRGALWVQIKTPAGPIEVVNTHLGLRPDERRRQIDALFSDQWLAQAADDRPLVLCGDFNAGLRSAVYKKISVKLCDVQRPERWRGKTHATFFSWYPVLRLDHIFVSDHFTPLRVDVPQNRTTRTASDHLPLWVDLLFKSRPAWTVS